MSTIALPPVRRSQRPASKAVEYPTSDGKPMAETEKHRRDLTDSIEMLDQHFADRADVCVSGNMLMFYEEGNKRKHVSPDVFVTFGIPRRIRENYLIWKEGKGPDWVLELTSKSTKKEDQETKFQLYQDVLKVREYMLFDPDGDYLSPRLQGYRLRGGKYLPIETAGERLPSEVLKLEIAADGWKIRYYDPASGQWLLTGRERAEAERRRADAIHAENERLRQELEAVRRAR